ncbi:hypothetical protein MMC25_006238 [Agyrium rufum]|nr:hypothetical protein [Agyrium rufum]
MPFILTEIRKEEDFAPVVPFWELYQGPSVKACSARQWALHLAKLEQSLVESQRCRERRDCWYDAVGGRERWDFEGVSLIGGGRGKGRRRRGCELVAGWNKTDARRPSRTVLWVDPQSRISHTSVRFVNSVTAAPLTANLYSYPGGRSLIKWHVHKQGFRSASSSPPTGVKASGSSSRDSLGQECYVESSDDGIRLYESVEFGVLKAYDLGLWKDGASEDYVDLTKRVFTRPQQRSCMGRPKGGRNVVGKEFELLAVKWTEERAGAQ